MVRVLPAQTSPFSSEETGAPWADPTPFGSTPEVAVPVVWALGAEGEELEDVDDDDFDDEFDDDFEDELEDEWERELESQFGGDDQSEGTDQLPDDIDDDSEDDDNSEVDEGDGDDD